MLVPRSIDRQRMVRLTIGLSAGLTLFVWSTLAWLGWRLLTQEAVLDRQRERDRTEQIADSLVAAVLRNLIEAEASLGRTEPEGTHNLPPGAVFVELTTKGVRTVPHHSLVYYPVALKSVQPIPDESHFRESNVLEFIAKDYRSAARKLADLESSADRLTATEARLRLARVLVKDGRSADALLVYSRLVNDETPSAADVPYAVLARFAKCQSLAASGARSMLREAAAGLLRDLHSGRWILARDSYLYYVAAAKQLGDVVLEPDAARLALTEAVGVLWDDWRLFRLGHARVPGTRVHNEQGIALLALVKAEENRAVAVMIPRAALAEFLMRGIRTPGSVSLLDEHGGIIFGEPKAGETAVVRSLSSARIPWQLRVSAGNYQVTTNSGHGRPFVLGLVAIAAIVAAACYAMARGVIRETRAGQLQADFVSAVSHEFRSPLSGLRQLTEMLAHGRVPDESRRHLYFEALQKETARLQRLVEDLLDFGRMERRQVRYHFERMDFFEFVRECVPSWIAEAKPVGFQIEFAGADGAAPVRGDAESLRRVFRNLLENAMRYSPECRTVWVETARENGGALLRVRDRGIGIDRADQRRIFEKFVRGEAAQRVSAKGVGLGLAMVQEIVGAHSGEVAVSSSLGEGSTFTVRLPLASEEEA